MTKFPGRKVSLIITLVIIGTTLTKGTYKLCSCCENPSHYRGIELNGSVCLQLLPFPPGIPASEKYELIKEEDVNLVVEFLTDYVYYPQNVPLTIGLNDQTVWSRAEGITKTENNLSNFYYTNTYQKYIEDNEKYTHTKCCS